MSWKKQKQKQSDSSSVGAAVAVGATAAIGFAALAWGAKKLYDLVSEEKTPCAEGASYSASRPPPPASASRAFPPNDVTASTKAPRIKVRNPASPELSPTAPVVARGWDPDTASASSTDDSSFSLIDDDVTPSIVQNELIDYYDNYVYIPKRVGRNAMHAASNVIKIIQSHVEMNCPGLTGDFMGTGSAFDGTQIIRPADFDVLMPIRMSQDVDDQCTSVSGRESLGWDSASGFSLVLVPESPLELPGVLEEKLMVDDKYISPMRARILFRELIQDAVKEYPPDGEYQLTVSSVGGATSVNVAHDELQLHLNFTPAVRLGTRIFTADPYPRSEQEHDCEEGYRKLWQESFAHQEALKLTSLTPHDHCHVRCLKIMKAICANDNLQLRKLSAYHCKTLLFYLMDKESDWESSKLGERVSDMLNLLDFYLTERRLPHYYLPEINLFEEFGRHELDDLKNYITSMLRKGNITALLKTNF